MPQARFQNLLCTRLHGLHQLRTNGFSQTNANAYPQLLHIAIQTHRTGYSSQASTPAVDLATGKSFRCNFRLEPLTRPPSGVPSLLLAPVRKQSLTASPGGTSSIASQLATTIATCLRNQHIQQSWYLATSTQVRQSELARSNSMQDHSRRDYRDPQRPTYAMPHKTQPPDNGGISLHPGKARTPKGPTPQQADLEPNLKHTCHRVLEEESTS